MTSGIGPAFVVGVTGHRDIAAGDIDGLRAALGAVLSDLAGRFANVPVRLATGLAEGADQLAAEVALELGLAVDAVLPMPREHYEADFRGPALERFRKLVEDPRVRVAEIPLAEGVDPAGMADQALRDRQYRMLGNYLTRRANTLIALWDGEVNGLEGGTSDVILRYLADGRDLVPNRVEHDESPAEGCGNLLIWLPVRRGKVEGDFACAPRFIVSNANYNCYWEDAAIPGHILRRWAGFDAYVAEHRSELGADLPAWGLGESEGEVSPDLAALEAEYFRADQLARVYERRSYRMFALFGAMAGAMGVAFLIYAKLLSEPVFLWIYLGIFVAGFLGFRYAARHHLHAKHLAFRALAETYRVQYFLIVSGAGAAYSLRRIIALTSVDQFTRFEWLQDAIRCAEPLVYFGHGDSFKALEMVRQYWIEDQSGYFDKKLRRLHAAHRRLEVVKKALLLGSVVGALALIFFKDSYLHHEIAGHEGKSWLVFFMGVLPLGAAVWELYQGKMATRELLWQYTNQRRYFRAAALEIAQTPELADGQKIIRDLADKALVEIYLWSVHRFHREHEPPSAG